MWNGYKPNKAEKQAIEGAYYYLADCQLGSRNRLDALMKQERSGYGSKLDSIPTIGAKALCVKWFLEGVNRPDALLRDTFEMRPAAVWLQGLGARKSTGAPAINMPCLLDAVAAHESAFRRMMDKDYSNIVRLINEAAQ
jgi:hypothetical protein